MSPLRKKLFICLLISFLHFPISLGIEMEKFRPIKADIVLAIDTACGGVGRSPELLDVEVIQHFLRKITFAFPLSPKESRMAIVEFGASARTRVNLTEGIDQKAIYAVYDDVSEWYDEEGVDRQGAVDYETMFRLVYTEIFTGAGGDRPEVPNLLMVLTIVPSFENEDPIRWRLRARMAARGFNYPEPDGVVATTGYATQRGTHTPKFTLTRGTGAFEPDGWYYQDFNNILHYAIVHLRHAMRSAWVDSFYAERQIRGIRTFDYTTCRIDPAFEFKVPDAVEHKLLMADIIFAIEIDRNAPAWHHDILRTLLLNVTRYLPIAPNWVRFWPVEFDCSGTFRILSSIHRGLAEFSPDQMSVYKTLVEKWVPESHPKYRIAAKEAFKEVFRVDQGQSTGGRLINLRALSTAIQKTLNRTARYPQVMFTIVVFPQPFPTSIDLWYRRFLRIHGPSLAGGTDALIVTSGPIPNASRTFTVAASPLAPGSGLLEFETQSFDTVRSKLFDFVINVTKAAVTRCGRCHYNSRKQCVVDVRSNWRNTSGIAFLDGRFCRNITGITSCPNKQTCAIECEHRPWSEWGPCWSTKMRKLVVGKGFRKRTRMPIDQFDTNEIFYRYCPIQKKNCVISHSFGILTVIPIIFSLFQA